jgi:hypothetical protein
MIHILILALFLQQPSTNGIHQSPPTKCLGDGGDNCGVYVYHGIPDLGLGDGDGPYIYVDKDGHIPSHKGGDESEMTVQLTAPSITAPSMNAVDVNGKPDLYARHQAKAAQDQADRNARIKDMLAERQKLVDTLRANRAAHEKQRELEKSRQAAPPVDCSLNPNMASCLVGRE